MRAVLVTCTGQRCWSRDWPRDVSSELNQFRRRFVSTKTSRVSGSSPSSAWTYFSGQKSVKKSEMKNWLVSS
jgi:hypothetical protein